MTTIRVTPCACIRASHCHRPGELGHLSVRTGGTIIPVRRCKACS